MSTAVRLSTDFLHIKKGGITLVVDDTTSDRKAIGRLEISNASLTWFPAGKKKGYLLKWIDLGKLVEEHGKPQK